MARGWESKDVESQLDNAEHRKQHSHLPHLSPEERQKLIRREQLEMDRVRVMGELQRACNPRFKGQLESELAFLEQELSKLG